MKSRLLATAAAIGLSVLAFGSPAHAVLVPTDNTFITAAAPSTLTFTYEGFSAGDTDVMRLAVGGQQIFINNVTPVGTVLNVAIPAGVTRLQLDDVTTGQTWFSGTAGNSDGAVHLQGTNTFSDFSIGAAAPFPITTNCAGPGGTCYLGWEDRPVNAADISSGLIDYNDLVFALQITQPVPEPASLSLLGAALVGMGWLTRRRRKTV